MNPGTGSRALRSAPTKVKALLVVALLAVTLVGVAPNSAGAQPPGAAPQEVAPDDWLGELNLLRAIGGLLPVTEEAQWSSADVAHSRWMVYNDFIMHGEITPPGFQPAFTASNPWYTPAGDLAGRNSNLILSTAPYTDVEAVRSWMTVPFHGVALIDPKLTRVGFGTFYDADDDTASQGDHPVIYRYGAALDVGSDLLAPVPRPVVAHPVVWPASGSVVHLTSYGGNESPDPLTHDGCNSFSGSVGLPLYVLFGAGVPGPSSAPELRTSSGHPVDICWFDGNTYNNPLPDHQQLGRDVLSSRNAVVAMPRHPLQVGEEYTFTAVRGGISATSTFTVGSEGVGANVQEFFDVPVDHPFYAEIAWMDAERISTGYADGTYQPAGTLTRMALSAFLYRFAGSPHGDDPQCDSRPFNDVPVDHTFCGEIAWMDETGISKGYGDGSYKPNDGLTRQAMSAFLYRVAGSPLGSEPECTGGAPFVDVLVSHPFCGEIAWMRDNAISEGYAGGLYQPNAVLTRMAMSAFLFRLDALLH